MYEVILASEEERTLDVASGCCVPRMDRGATSSADDPYGGRGMKNVRDGFHLLELEKKIWQTGIAYRQHTPARVKACGRCWPADCSCSRVR